MESMKDKTGEVIAPTDLKSATALSKEQIEELVKKVSKDDLMKAVTLVEKIPEEELTPLQFSIFDFQGFDPFSVIAVIKIICDHYKDPEKVMLSDIRFCIAACLYMGNIQAKALTKRAAEGRAKIEYLAQKYNMQVGSTGSGLSAETVTFPRVAASFPVLSIKMAWKIPPKAVNLDFLSEKVPSFMRLSPFASLCSSKMEEPLRIFLMECCNAHGADMSIAFEKGRLKKAKKEIKYDPVQIAQDQWAFVDVASGSPVPDELVKKSLLTKLNVGALYADIREVVINYRSVVTKRERSEISVLEKSEFDSMLSKYLIS